MTTAANDGDDIFADLFPAPRRRRTARRERARFELEVEPINGCPSIGSGRLRDLLASSKLYTADGLPLGKSKRIADGYRLVRIIRNGSLYLELGRAARVCRSCDAEYFGAHKCGTGATR